MKFRIYLNNEENTVTNYIPFKKCCEMYIKFIEWYHENLVNLPHIVDENNVQSDLFFVYGDNNMDKITNVLKSYSRRYAIVDETICIQTFSDEDENFVADLILDYLEELEEVEEETTFDFSIENIMRRIVGNDNVLKRMKADKYEHSRLIDMTMKAYTYLINPLPCDEKAKEVQKGHWEECMKYAKIHDLDKPCLTLNREYIEFFKQIF